MYAKYILTHLSEMLLDLSNPIKKATYFGALFNKMPTYAEIDLRTTKNSPLPEVNELFKLKTAFLSTYGELIRGGLSKIQNNFRLYGYLIACRLTKQGLGLYL